MIWEAETGYSGQLLPRRLESFAGVSHLRETIMTVVLLVLCATLLSIAAVAILFIPRQRISSLNADAETTLGDIDLALANQ